MAKVTQRQQKRQSATRQYGGRVLVFRGAPLQRGHGLGGLFKTLFRVAVPVLRRAAPIVKGTGYELAKQHLNVLSRLVQRHWKT